MWFFPVLQRNAWKNIINQHEGSQAYSALLAITVFFQYLVKSSTVKNQIFLVCFGGVCLFVWVFCVCVLLGCFLCACGFVGWLVKCFSSLFVWGFFGCCCGFVCLFFPQEKPWCDRYRGTVQCQIVRCNYWMPRWEIFEVVLGSTVPTTLMASGEAKKQNQEGKNNHAWTHLT